CNAYPPELLGRSCRRCGTATRRDRSAIGVRRAADSRNSLEMSAAAQPSLLIRRARWIAESRRMRAVVTLALLGVVAAQIDWSQMERQLSHGNPLDFVAAVALVLLALIIGACRWGWLLRGAGVHLDARQLTRVYAVSTFSSTFLPTTVGGDVTRALLVVRRGPLLTRVAVTILVDRVGGLVGLLGVAW